MAAKNISQAIETIWELIESLEQAYWASSSLQAKDAFTNLLQCLFREYIELQKLSVQDHHFEYEVVSSHPDLLFGLCQNMRNRLDDLLELSQLKMQLVEQLGEFTLAISRK
ncbi:MAG: hypothetical protein ACPGYX_12145 [Oceanobacter sp.]